MLRHCRCVETGTTAASRPIVTTTPSVNIDKSTTTPPRTTIFNPCTADNLRDGKLFFAYPGDERRYIHCTYFIGQATTGDCGEHHYFSEAVRTCLNNEPYDPDTGTFNEDVTNPCIETGTNGQLQYYEYPGDANKFIHCDQYGDAYIQSCRADLVWSQHSLSCVQDTRLIG
mgnify:CR=1 FL=1